MNNMQTYCMHAIFVSVHATVCAIASGCGETYYFSKAERTILAMKEHARWQCASCLHSSPRLCRKAAQGLLARLLVGLAAGGHERHDVQVADALGQEHLHCLLIRGAHHRRHRAARPAIGRTCSSQSANSHLLAVNLPLAD